jgi:DNA-binding transcriptional LysR family regulator
MCENEWLSAFSGERVDWSLLQAYRWVAHARSFRGAALETGISINTLRARVDRVEKLAGRKLLDRSVSGISVTGAGLALLELTDAVVAVLKREHNRKPSQPDTVIDSFH